MKHICHASQLSDIGYLFVGLFGDCFYFFSQRLIEKRSKMGDKNTEWSRWVGIAYRFQFLFLFLLSLRAHLVLACRELQLAGMGWMEQVTAQNYGKQKAMPLWHQSSRWTKLRNACSKEEARRHRLGSKTRMGADNTWFLLISFMKMVKPDF